ncbi:undecaprenyl-diphosphate phosphatase [Patescibacteria group bacterium]|nr:undecaprenyl-diphosphate phosphatase [Patescibacteria group bacterium]
MTIFDALFLGVLQGIAEFLPISSSGHLVIAERLLGLEVESLKSFDVMVHLGTLTAIIIYFWKDVVMLFQGFFGFLGFYKTNVHVRESQKLIFYIIIASIPAVLVGLFLGDSIDFLFRDLFYVGVWMIIVGEIFFLAEWYIVKYKKEKELNYPSAIIIGLAQAVALIPGVSRSGLTIATGLFRGLSREKAARFSFLMSMPVVFGAGLLTAIKEMKNASEMGLGISFSDKLDFLPLFIGFVSAALAGFASVYFLMKFIKNHTFKGFGVYLFVVGSIAIIMSMVL